MLKQRCCRSSALLCPCNSSHFDHQPVEALNEYILQMILFTRNPVKDVLTWKHFWLLQCFLKLFLSWMLIFLAAVWNQIQPLESILCSFMQVRTNSKNGTTTTKKAGYCFWRKRKRGQKNMKHNNLHFVITRVTPALKGIWCLWIWFILSLSKIKLIFIVTYISRRVPACSCSCFLSVKGSFPCHCSHYMC